MRDTKFKKSQNLKINLKGRADGNPLTKIAG